MGKDAGLPPAEARKHRHIDSSRNTHLIINYRARMRLETNGNQAAKGLRDQKNNFWKQRAKLEDAEFKVLCFFYPTSTKKAFRYLTPRKDRR